MSRYCLDTSAYSHFQRGEPSVVELIDRADWVGVPTVVLGELWIGFLLGSRLEGNLAELRAFLAHPAVQEVPVDDGVARHYGELVVDLRRRGKPLPTNDVWVAACASHTGGTVLTYDDHFRSIERVPAIILDKRPQR